MISKPTSDVGNITMKAITTVNATIDEDAIVNLGAAAWLDAVLLPVVVLVIVFDLLLVAALIADTVTVRSIRWILGNILTANVVGALGSGVRHTFQISTLFDANIGRYILTACQVYFPLMALGTSGRVLMYIFYSITVFTVVKWWNKPVLAPRNTKYFVFTTVVVWVLIILLSAPSFVFASTQICSAGPVSISSAEVVPVMVLSNFPILFTLLFLVITVWLIKRQTITVNSAGRKALLKFGFFLLVGQGINAIGQLVFPTVYLLLSSTTYQSVVITLLTVIYDLSLIPTPILICIFFKPVQLKLRTWLCICCRACSVRNTASQPADHIYI